MSEMGGGDDSNGVGEKRFLSSCWYLSKVTATPVQYQ